MQNLPTQNMSPEAAAKSRLGLMFYGAGCVSLFMIGIAIVFLAMLLITLPASRTAWTGVALGAVVPVIMLAIALFATLPYALRARKGLTELNEGRSTIATGNVTWSGKGYAIEAAGQKLDALSGVELMPGAYTFTVLPESRYVVHAARMDTGNAEAEAAQVGNALASVFGFDAADLAACRTGQLSPSHQARVVRDARGSLVFIGIIGAIFVVAGVAPALFQLTPGRFQVSTALIGLLFAAAGGFVIYAGAGMLRAAQKGAVQMIEGPVTERTSSSKNSRTYYYVVNNQSFTVTKAAQTALVAGQTYRVYFLPNTSKIVAIEPA
jgi:uncharacterized integral membrane protein